MKDILENSKPEDPIGAAKAEFLVKIWDSSTGVICPLCDRSTRVIPARLHNLQGRSLIWLYQNTKPGEYVHFNRTAPRVLVKHAQVGTMKHWGFVEQLPNTDDPTKIGRGFVRITPAGRAFVEGAETYKRLYIYTHECFGEPPEKERVTIWDVLGSPLDTRKIMVPAI